MRALQAPETKMTTCNSGSHPTPPPSWQTETTRLCYIRPATRVRNEAGEPRQNDCGQDHKPSSFGDITLEKDILRACPERSRRDGSDSAAPDS